MAGLLITPLILTSYQLPFGAHYTIANGSVVASRTDSETLLQTMKYVDCAMYSTLTCVEFALIVGAIMRVRRFKISQLPDQRRVQIKLLAYTVYMAFVQLLRALFFVAMALYLQIPWFRNVVITFHPLIELYCFSGTVFLLLASSHTRSAFLTFYGLGSKEDCFVVQPLSTSG
ncbi:hypothetical protein AAVH_41189 [Aphelenchoides avenae]|nr:hypothetical protein AAVH_41189 [Aphelenchus avenae]